MAIAAAEPQAGTFVPNGRHLAAAAWLHLVAETIADIEGGALNA
jgi:hypothetical protein